MSGIPTGQDVPQDVSLSIENLPTYKDGDYEPPYSEEYMESSTELSWEDLLGREELYNEEKGRNINPCQGSTSEEPQQSPLDTKLNIPTPSPHSVAPPFPSPSHRGHGPKQFHRTN